MNLLDWESYLLFLFLPLYLLFYFIFSRIVGFQYFSKPIVLYGRWETGVVGLVLLV